MKKMFYVTTIILVVVLSMTGAFCSKKDKNKTEEISSPDGTNQNRERTDHVTDADKGKIDEWIQNHDVNQYGDTNDTVYAGGTPLFDETTGETKDRYEYIIEKHPELVDELELNYRPA